MAEKKTQYFYDQNINATERRINTLIEGMLLIWLVGRLSLTSKMKLQILYNLPVSLIKEMNGHAIRL